MSKISRRGQPAAASGQGYLAASGEGSLVLPVYQYGDQCTRGSLLHVIEVVEADVRGGSGGEGRNVSRWL
jgi:hypothetical protein